MLETMVKARNFTLYFVIVWYPLMMTLTLLDRIPAWASIAALPAGLALPVALYHFRYLICRIIGHSLEVVETPSQSTSIATCAGKLHWYPPSWKPWPKITAPR